MREPRRTPKSPHESKSCRVTMRVEVRQYALFKQSGVISMLFELPSGYRAPTAARDNVLLEVIDEEDSEGGVYAGVQARGVAASAGW